MHQKFISIAGLSIECIGQTFPKLALYWPEEIKTTGKFWLYWHSLRVNIDSNLYFKMEIFRKNEIFLGIRGRGILEKEFFKLKKSPGFLGRGIYRGSRRKGSAPLARKLLAFSSGTEIARRPPSAPLRTGSWSLEPGAWILEPRA